MRCLLLVPLLLLPSCVVVAAGAVAAVAYGAISYSNNEASMTVHEELPKCFGAAREAMLELGFAVDGTQQPGITEGKLHAGEAHVLLERHAGEVTKIRVRVGSFDTEDNRRRAGLLLEAIRAKI